MKTVIAYAIIGYAIYYFGKKRYNKWKESTPEFKQKQNEEFIQTQIDQTRKSYLAAQKAGLVIEGLNISDSNSKLEVPNIGPYDGLVGWAAYVVATKSTSTTISEIQRTLKLNYERACNLSDALMELGITKSNGTKQHTVMIADLNRIKALLDNL